jgi:hypothetical protein
MLPMLLLMATPAPGQTLAGAEFARFARAADRQCPARHWRSVAPADLLQAEDDFLAASPAQRRHAVRVAIARDGDGQPRACADRNGASCPAIHQLAAIRKAGASAAFVRSVCRAR